MTLRAALLPLVLSSSIAMLAGCSKTEPASGPAVLTPVPAPAPTAAVAAPGATTAAFDFNSVPVNDAALPPFPYLEYPEGLHVGVQFTDKHDFDSLAVIAGTQLLPVEGRVEERMFHNSDTTLSGLAARRNYENAVKALGFVKVNTVDANDAAFIKANGDDGGAIGKQLRRPETQMSYDAYLRRTTQGRVWIVLMFTDDKTRFISIEEKAIAPAIAYIGGGAVKLDVPPAAAPQQPVDINALPVSSATLPAFPYVGYPTVLNKANEFNSGSAFDAAAVIVGDKLQTLEGRIDSRQFHHSDAKLSEVAVRRNYQAALLGLGAVKVNTIGPTNDAFMAANADNPRLNKLLHFDEPQASYDVYLLRTPATRVWFALMVSDRKTRLLTVEEKAFAQTVGYVKADAMRSELAARGRVALYINFDTDKASIRSDGKPAVDEITTLLKQDPALKLTIEGHTDNSGDAKRNKDLSQRRADAVRAVLEQAGIDKARLVSTGLGDTRPLQDNKDEAGRAKNRRVELVKRG